MMISLFLVCLQQDTLADLARRASEWRSFSAVFELSSTASPDKTRIQVEYVAPARVRIDRAVGATQTSMWCVDGVIAMSSRGEQSLAGRFDSAGVFAELEPCEQALHAAFPQAEPPCSRDAALGMRWSFDAQSKQANFIIEAQLGNPLGTAFGWLDTLHQKHAEAREDGDLLRFETDDAFQVAISQSTGFLQEFAGKSPQGDLHLVLVSLDPKAKVDAARFELPQPIPGARDITADLMRGVNRSAEVDLRRRIYAAIGSGAGSAAWDEAQQAAIAGVLRPFHERSVRLTLATTLARWDTIRETVAGRVQTMRKDGKSEQEIAQLKEREGGYLKKQLDEFEQGFSTRLALPQGVADLPRAKALLALEGRALSDAFRTQVREPVMSAFERAMTP